MKAQQTPENLRRFLIVRKALFFLDVCKFSPMVLCIIYDETVRVLQNKNKENFSKYLGFSSKIYIQIKSDEKNAQKVGEIKRKYLTMAVHLC